MNEPLSSIMSTDLITIHPEAVLTEVRRLFMKSRIHHLPVVVNDNELVGLLTTYDLFKSNVTQDDFDRVKVKEVMTTSLATLEPHDKIGVAAEIFLENLFHAVPVVTGNRLVGIVTSFDVLKYEFQKAYPNQLLNLK